MMRQAWFGCVGLIVLCVATWGDTVYFKDGSTLDGKVNRPNENSVGIQVGEGHIEFPASDVERVEENDKKGAYSLDEYRARKHEDIMLERTGLTREQRDAARKLVMTLGMEDPRVRKEAREKLKELSKEMPIFQYLAASLPYERGDKVPVIMRVMVELDPEQSKEMLAIRSQDPDPASRANALELIGKVMKKDGLDTIAQGMVDQDEQIQIAAAQTMGELGDKRASLVLLQGLESNNKPVQNACRNALTKLWSSESTKADFETADEWKGFLDGRRSQLSKAVDPAKLTPLVEPTADGKAPQHVDE